MKFLQGIGFGFGAAYVLAIIAGVIGWVLNIIAVVHSLSGPVTAMLVARLVGIPVFILGAILGWVS
jgi:hypothetical protein